MTNPKKNKTIPAAKREHNAATMANVFPPTISEFLNMDYESILRTFFNMTRSRDSTPYNERVKKCAKLFVLSDRIKASIERDKQRIVQGTPTYPVCVTPPNFPGMHLLDSQKFAHELDEFCRQASIKMSQLVIKFQEKALAKVRADIVDLLKDWNPTKEEEAAIWRLTSMRTRTQRKAPKPQEPYWWFRHTDSDGNPGLYYNPAMLIRGAKRVGKMRRTNRNVRTAKCLRPTI